MSNWFDSHVVVIGIGDVDTDAIKDAIKQKVEEAK
jgi:NADPH-dependent glutamate synthase beta subunit-like oxidoreductase